MTIEDAARAACLELGLMPPNHFERDKFQVIHAEDGRAGNGAGRIKIFADGRGGIVQNWKTGDKRSFFLKDADQKPHPQTPAEKRRAAKEKRRIEAARREREAKQAEQRAKAARRALAIWNAAKPAPVNHAYLVRKQVAPHGIRVGVWRRTIQNENGEPKTLSIDSVLLVPLFNGDGQIQSLQGIFEAQHPLLGRDKDFLPGGGLCGLFWWIGPKTSKVLIAEGFATGATLFEQTGLRVYLAFTANNLMAVGRVVRSRLPDAELIFCADNDETAGNPGLTKATEAALAVDGLVLAPPEFGDWNDYINRGGSYE